MNKNKRIHDDKKQYVKYYIKIYNICDDIINR